MLKTVKVRAYAKGLFKVRARAPALARLIAPSAARIAQGQKREMRDLKCGDVAITDANVKDYRDCLEMRSLTVRARPRPPPPAPD